MPMPKRTAVTVVNIKNFNTGICEICAHRLTTSAVEQPMISKPPMISPQRMLLSSMKELSISENDRRDARGGGVNCSYAGGGAATGSSSGAMKVGTGLITISSSLGVSDAMTIDIGGSAG